MTLDPLTGDPLPQNMQTGRDGGKGKVFIPDLSDDELRTLAREKLSAALQHIDPLEHPEMTRKLCAEVKDRLDGKPTQAIKQTTDININVMQERQIEARANMKAIMQLAREKLLLPPLVEHDPIDK